MARKLKPEEAIAKAEEKIGAIEFGIYDKSGAFVRSYSASIHGEEFYKLAEGFAKKIGGKIDKIR